MKEKSQRILLVGPSWVGDMIMANSLMRWLKHKHGDELQLDVVAPAWTQALTLRMSEVNEVYALPVGHGELKFKTRWQVAQRLKQNEYHKAYVLPNSWKSALVPWMSGIPERIGWLGEKRYRLLTQRPQASKSQYPYMVEQYLALGLDDGQALPDDYPLPHLQVDRDDAYQLAESLSLSLDKPVIALAPGAEFGSSKRWPPDYFAQLAQAKLDQGYQIWLMGSPNDKPVTQAITQQTKGACYDLAGQTNLAQAIDILSLAERAVTNDSGLMHVACALDLPVVALFGSTSPDFTPPLHPKAQVLSVNVPCQPCFQRTCPIGNQRCMKDLKPAYVLQALAD